MRAAVITLVAGALIAGPWPGSALAGTYDVQACGGGPNQSWTPSTSGAMTAAPGFPGCSDEGLVAQNQPGGTGATVPAGSAARWRFDAPPGTQVTGVKLSADFGAADAGWQAALSNGQQLLTGCAAGSSPCLQGPRDTYLDIPPSASIYTEALCTSGSCPANSVRAKVALRSVAVRLTDDRAPEVADPNGPAWKQAWVGSTSGATFNALDASGITSVSALVDGQEVGFQSRACNTYLPRCDNWSDAAVDVNVRGFDDGAHTLTLKAVDRAGNAGVQTREFGVDTTAPPLPEGVHLADGAGSWRPTATSRLTWANPAQPFAPIVGSSYEACVTGTAECTTGTDDEPSALDLSLPHPGLYDIRVWLRDAAGNTTKQNAAAPVQVGWDADSPTDVAFALIDPDQPAVIRVLGRDATSGIAGGTIEYRRRGRQSWRPIKAALADGAVVATMPDGRLPDGDYDLRATVQDAAGNARSTGTRTNGRRAGVTLPLRVKARLLVGQPRRSRGRKGRIKLDATPRVRVGRRARLAGRLVAPGGNPIAGAPIEVATRPAGPGKAYVAVGTLKTGRSGRFAYKSPPGANRTVRFTYAGAAKIRPQQRRVRVRVPAESTIRASRHRVVNGEAVRFTGRVTTGPLPATGKLVELQFYDRGRWRTFRTAHADRRGRWKYTYRFSGTVGRRVYRFRVHMPRESGYTYAEGGSRAVRVTVQGL